MVKQHLLADCAVHGRPNGCVQIDYGVDGDATGMLDHSSEIDGTEYVCHGTNGDTPAAGWVNPQGPSTGIYRGLRGGSFGFQFFLRAYLSRNSRHT